jgi:hypothetical protein
MPMEPVPDLPPVGTLTAKKKRLLLVTVAIILIVGVSLATFTLFRQKPSQQTTVPAANTNKNFTMTTDGSAVTYAGNPVYDACGLIAFDTVRANVGNYQTLLDMNDTDQKPSEALTIEHRYFDRNMSTPLGKDGVARPTSAQVGSAAVDSTSFISTFDSNCWYGQGNDLSLGIGKTFAKVYVTQKPTPLSSDFLVYAPTLTKAASTGDITAYVEPQKDSGGFFTSILVDEKKGIAVFIKTANLEFAKKATLEVGDRLTEAPKAPMNLTYPLGWSKMPNPCTLLTANDFEQITGKPASALAEDTMGLNEIGGRIIQRSCERLEVERLDGTPIAETNVTIRMGKDEAAAKEYVDHLKNNQEDAFDIQSLKQRIAIADDAYVKVVKDRQIVKNYEFDMRIGQAVIVLAVSTDAGLDSSADAFAGRILPIAQKVVERYKQ